MQILAADIGTEIDAGDRVHGSDAVELFQGTLGKLHGQRRKSEQPVGILTICIHQRVVEGLGEARGKSLVPEIDHRLGQRQRLHRHVLPVHLGDTWLEIYEAVRQRADLPVSQVEKQPVIAMARGHIVGSTITGQRLDIGGRKIVCVNVNSFPHGVSTPP